MATQLTNEQLEADRARRGLQDKKTPFLIHRTNGRLLPNVERLRAHKDMLPYKGSSKASLEERMRLLRTGSNREVTQSEPDEPLPPFDLSRATREEMIAFARDEYGITLNPNAPPHILRNQIKKAASGDSSPDDNLG